MKKPNFCCYRTEVRMTGRNEVKCIFWTYNEDKWRVSACLFFLGCSERPHQFSLIRVFVSNKLIGLARTGVTHLWVFIESIWAVRLAVTYIS